MPALYLDLLAKTLTGMIYEDPPIDPWHGILRDASGAQIRPENAVPGTYTVHPGAYDPAVRALGQDWPLTALTMIGLERLRNLQTLITRVIADGISGDFLEAGIWRGGACIFMRGVLAAHGCTSRKVIGVDSFAGLPRPAVPQDAGDNHHVFPTLAVSRAEVERNFDRYGFLDSQTVLLEGLFGDVLPKSNLGPIALLRLDGDMYASTMDVLTACYPLVPRGGYVVIDDYNLPAVRAAISDFLGSRGLTGGVPVRIDRSGIYFKKED